MNNNLLFFLVLLLTFSFGNLFSQRKCLTDEYNHNLERQNPQRAQKIVIKRNSFNNWKKTKSFSIPDTIIIPIIFHVVHNGESIGSLQNPNEEKINEQLKILNDIYANKNLKGVDIKVQFCLAKQNSFGLASSGIKRYRGRKKSFTIENVLDTTFIGDDFMLKSRYRDNNFNSISYLNVWIANTNLLNEKGKVEDLPGYSTFPWETELIRDGIVINYKYFGLNNTYDGSLGKTLAHEIGHWLGLLHTFEPFGSTQPNNCLPELDCASEGDKVCDTEKRNDSFLNIGKNVYGESINPNNCYFGKPCSKSGNRNVVQNYMDYNFDNCYSFFTQGQKKRMMDHIKFFRPILYTDKPLGCENTNNSSSSITPCNMCYEPYLLNPYKIFFGQKKRNKTFVKNNLYIDVEESPRRFDDYNITVYERVNCSDFEEQKTFNYYDSSTYSPDFERVEIIDDNTFVVKFYQGYYKYKGKDLTLFLIFKKINSKWMQVGKIQPGYGNMDPFGYDGHIFFTYISPYRNSSFFRISNDYNSYYKLGRIQNIPGSLKRSKNLFFKFSDKGFKEYQFYFHQSRRLNTYLLSPSTAVGTHNFLNYKIVELSQKNNILILLAHKTEHRPKYRYSIFIFKKKNKIWSLYQEIHDLKAWNYHVNVISEKFIMIGTKPPIYHSGEMVFYKDNGLRFEEIDLSHLNSNSTSINSLCSRNYNNNFRLNEIVLDNITLKMSDVLGEDIPNSINSESITTNNYGNNIIVDYYGVIDNKSFNAGNSIIFKPGVRIKPNVIAQISDSNSSMDCVFSRYCLPQPTSKSSYSFLSKLNKQDNITSKSINIYPNPNNGVFYINNIKNVSRVQLYTMMGQLLLDKNLNGNNEIEMPTNKKGVYNLVLFKTDGQKEYIKVLVQ